MTGVGRTPPDAEWKSASDKPVGSPDIRAVAVDRAKWPIFRASLSASRCRADDHRRRGQALEQLAGADQRPAVVEQDFDRPPQGDPAEDDEAVLDGFDEARIREGVGQRDAGQRGEEHDQQADRQPLAPEAAQFAQFGLLFPGLEREMVADGGFQFLFQRRFQRRRRQVDDEF